MLASLSIKNFALIEKLSISFSDGFSVITGETGAGKSILLGALGMLLGKRADLSSLRNKEEKCVVEAYFNISGYKLQDFFTARDLDYEDVTIIRREILPSGKSRAFVNDSPVNLQELQDLGLFLIDIHSQHQTQELSDESMQFQIIDSIAGNQDLTVDFSLLLKVFRKEQQSLSALKNQLSEAKKEQEYNTFLLEELISAKLVAGSQEVLESTYEQLNNVELIKEMLNKSLALSDEEQFGVLQNLKEIKTALQKIAGVSQDYSVLTERIGSITIEFDDIVSEMNRYAENLVDDPEQRELISTKLQTIYTLQKKHQVLTVEELISIQAELQNKVVSVDNLEADIKKLEQSVHDSKLVLDTKAEIISNKRREAIPVLSDKLVEILSFLSMPNVRFNIELLTSESYHANGKDEIRFLFSANKGSDFGLLKKVASGGEMSRIMLAVKAILARYSKLPTIIFDEIDTGVSGEIANKMAKIMKSMSKDMQVFAITHLPQIAAKGDEHFKVFKSTTGEYTQSELKHLSREERISEIAEMLSGKDISESALTHAKALLG